MIRIEYRYPWAAHHWRCYGRVAQLSAALELLDECRQNHPGSECRTCSEKLPQEPARESI
jgi:hypothetical protein